ncbi:IMV membrane protein [Equine molluscum contagiosum-like virus]|nr:IMV membrane protein [Equine molluscum contagiosum-like virus]
MDKLYAGIFGVFMTTPEDDFEEFLDIVQSVLTDAPRAGRARSRGSFASFLLYAGLATAILVFLYLKLAKTP